MNADGTILLVEDNADDVALAMHAFRKNAISNRVIVSEDGQKALDYLLGSSDPSPALVLLDINIPKISGVEVLHAMRRNERTRLLPVVMLTTSSDERDVVNSYAAGANSFISKPVDFTRFTEAIRQIVAYWLDLNTMPPARKRPEAAAEALQASDAEATAR